MKFTRSILTIAALSISAAGAVGGEAPATAAPSVYTVTGTVFHDADRDGVFSLGELPLAKAAVELYGSAEDAAARTGALRTVTGALDGKTLIFIDVLATNKAFEDGSLAAIDVTSALTTALGGSLDLGDAIRFRTTANGRPLSFSDVPQGAYVVMRSPFDLTIGDLLANTSRVTALIDLLGSAGTRTITLTGLVPGENTVAIDWSAGVYDGGTIALSVVR